ncbi:MAG TPA: tripartite tricarboxylate transporter substrate binding protein, partial [Afifellaceae bacterium]|nr:tripartite tricarboxylate transporter substrate binding protein [Afifellaceae bacterium]
MRQSFRAAVLGAAVAAIAAIAPAAAQESWPERPIRMVVPYNAGGGTDLLARILAEPLTDILGQPVVVENRPGAGGTIGADSVAKSEPDGYTAYMMANGHAIAAVVNAELPYEPADDFQPVSLVATMPLVILANNDFPADDIAGAIELGKADATAVDFAAVGVGSTQHFAGALLFQVAGIDATYIPYERTPNAIAALISGEVPILVETLAPSLGQIAGGEVKALALTSAEGHPAVPDVPSVSEALPEYDVATWYGVVFPAGTPREIVDKMNAAIREAIGREEVRNQALEAAFLVTSSSPEEFDEHLRSEIERWSQV